MAIKHSETMDFDVVLAKDETGVWVADVPLLPGCHTQGGTRVEALANIREAIELYLEVAGVPKGRLVEIERVRVEA